MPAYNSAATIADAVNCILAQTFSDLELIVSDNASTDGTLAILQDIAARDGRVRIIRQPENIGANSNYSAVAMTAQGEYFKWVSSSDWCPPEFIERCVTFLDSHPDAALVAPAARLFESDPARAMDYPDDIDLREDDPVDRLWQLASKMRLNNAMNGLIRMDALRQTQLIQHFRASDIVLIGHLALLGKICLLPDRLLYRRMEEKTATRLMSPDEVMRHHYPVPTARALFPTWRYYFGWFRAISSTPLRAGQKWRAWRAVLRMFRWDRGALWQDFLTAAKFPFARSG